MEGSRLMRYFKERGRCLRRDSLAANWGECTRYVEIGDDRYAVRQVEVYNKGRVLRYERSHWCDRFGQLSGCLFSEKQKAIDGRLTAEVIDTKEFERACARPLTRRCGYSRLSTRRQPSGVSCLTGFERYKTLNQTLRLTAAESRTLGVRALLAATAGELGCSQGPPPKRRELVAIQCPNPAHRQ